MNVPAKLQMGDEIRIVAPSRSGAILSEVGVKSATERLETLGFKVTFGKYTFESDLHHSASIEHRVEDIHEAFRDSAVKGILTVIGGFNSNELLPYLDYDLIGKNPKVFCGYSDITAIATAITTKTGMVTYSGPHFSSFSMDIGREWQTEFFKRCLMQDVRFGLTPSEQWSDDSWYMDQENRTFEPTKWKVYNEGMATGRVFGANLCTLNLLQGTEYMPELRDSILFIEDDDMTIPETFARDLTSLLQVAGSIRGLVIGRFQRESNVSDEHIRYILGKHPMLQHIPVLYDVDFGHTQPMFTFPIGGEAVLDSRDCTIELKVF
ncbi:S66 family peptidase [Sporosarcina gallistercoris]|uniref:LD-carboxypeptidase n=1 Tax=Sporosarcina gallistercoris TaxID=2762245 RepID=A0ABR8PJ04_9BACL|nr:S66 peptidase family protein [Sporosarcina gallistercoris]MBD7908137.1 LD-carboxypeptidase [Sporosarcina gallistercoris]